MKKLVLISNLIIVLLSSCATQKVVTYNDDVYADPQEDRIEAARVAAIKKQQDEAIAKRYNDSTAAIKQAQKVKDDANPYYKDREFKYDDYYDYEYATRVKRFDNSINGLSYYDNYYTNSYWYNKNPYNYGVSVYNGYSWWGSSYNSYSYNPSVNFYNNNGWGCNSGYGYNGYNPYMAGYTQGYNNGFTNGYYGNYYGYGNPYGGYGSPFGYGNSFGYGYPYNGYAYPYGYGGYGYNNGYNNSYNNGWGYYNSYDNNSSYTYGPRSSHGGGNSQRTSNPGVNTNGDSYYQKFVSSVTTKQEQEVKFTEIVTPRTNLKNTSSDNTLYNDGVKGQTKVINDNNGTTPKTETRWNTDHSVQQSTKENAPVKMSTENGNIKNSKVLDNNESVPLKNQSSQYHQENQQMKQTKQFESTPKFEAPSRQNNTIQSTPSNGGTPVNNGGSRPR